MWCYIERKYHILSLHLDTHNRNVEKKIIFLNLWFLWPHFSHLCVMFYFYSYNSIVIMGWRIWIRNVSIENIKKCQLVELQGSWLLCENHIFWWVNWDCIFLGLPIILVSKEVGSKQHDKTTSSGMKLCTELSHGILISKAMIAWWCI